jgi:two-component system chemotaxis response regulator CheB
VITHPRARLGSYGVAPPDAPPTTAGARIPRRRYQVVAIGASTGGPGAILEVLRQLPVPYPLPILIVLHVGEPFAAAFADWLDRQTRLRVSYACDGDLVTARTGQVVLAPAESHLTVLSGRLRLTRDTPRRTIRRSDTSSRPT